MVKNIELNVWRVKCPNSQENNQNLKTNWTVGKNSWELYIQKGLLSKIYEELIKHISASFCQNS